jgi:isopentenyl-diphosphate delta-isomerase
VTAAPESLILVDECDNALGTADRETCHRGAGIRHRAFVLWIENARRDVLLQWRLPRKLGGGRWDVSATSHVRHGETYEAAVARCAQHELGITAAVPWRRVVSYVYTEALGDHSENEFCWLFAGEYLGPIRINELEIGAVQWVTTGALAAGIRAAPDQYTGWLRAAVAQLAL